MIEKNKVLIFDSWAIIAYLQGEKSSEKIANLIEDALENQIELLMTVVNKGEVWYIIARSISEVEADRTIQEIEKLGIKFIDIDWELTRIAAGYKAKYKMSYADCFAASLAKLKKAELVTGDEEFRQIEKDIKIAWL